MNDRIVERIERGMERVPKYSAAWFDLKSDLREAEERERAALALGEESREKENMEGGEECTSAEQGAVTDEAIRGQDNDHSVEKRKNTSDNGGFVVKSTTMPTHSATAAHTDTASTETKVERYAVGRQTPSDQSNQTSSHRHCNSLSAENNKEDATMVPTSLAMAAPSVYTGVGIGFVQPHMVLEMMEDHLRENYDNNGKLVIAQIRCATNNSEMHTSTETLDQDSAADI
jgi:hypothetical protein